MRLAPWSWASLRSAPWSWAPLRSAPWSWASLVIEIGALELRKAEDWRRSDVAPRRSALARNALRGIGEGEIATAQVDPLDLCSSPCRPSPPAVCGHVPPRAGRRRSGCRRSSRASRASDRPPAGTPKARWSRRRRRCQSASRGDCHNALSDRMMRTIRRSDDDDHALRKPGTRRSESGVRHAHDATQRPPRSVASAGWRLPAQRRARKPERVPAERSGESRSGTRARSCRAMSCAGR